MFICICHSLSPPYIAIDTAEKDVKSYSNKMKLCVHLFVIAVIYIQIKKCCEKITI